MQKQKNNHNITIYQKWFLYLIDIKCKLKLVDIFLLLTLAINKGIIVESIDIVQKLAKQLKLLDKFIKNKLILVKRKLMTIWNYQYKIYRQQEKNLLLNKFHWFEPMVSLFYL